MSEPTVSKVVSRDDTEIAYWTSGGGPPLVLVHGTTADHTTWRALTPHLEPQVTVHAMDRRGRGASADGARYEAVREFEDVAAVVDAIRFWARCSLHARSWRYQRQRVSRHWFMTDPMPRRSPTRH